MSQPDRVLAMLRAGPKTTGDFCETDLVREYPRAIWTLRRRGYVITTERVRAGCWKFTLVSEPQAVQMVLDNV